MSDRAATTGALRRYARRTTNKVAGVVRKHKPDYTILAYATILVVVGLIIIFAIGPQRANLINGSFGGEVSSTHFVVKQFSSVGLSIVAFFGCAFFLPIETLQRRSLWLMGAAVAACILLFILGNVLHVTSVTQCALGACRWFVLPGIGTFQPAELLKLAVLVYMAGFLAVRMRQGTVNDSNQTLIPAGVFLAVCIALVVLAQKDLGTGVALLAIMAVMFIVAGLSKRTCLMIGGGLLVLGMCMVIIAPHRMDRLATFLKGDEVGTDDPSAYHVTQAKIAIGSGGLFGVGVGNSVQATGYVPEAINDSIIAILGETFGFVGLVFILAVFFLLLMRLLGIMDHSPNHTHRLLVAGVFGWIGSHVVINIMAMTGLIPLTGITLPFLSFGGTSMVFIAIALGLVLQASQYTTHNPNQKGETHDEGSGSRRRVGRARYANSRSY